MIPAYRILADAADVTAALAGRLASLRLTDKPGMEADQLDLTLFDSGDVALPRRGVTLTVALGWQGQPLTDKGAYVVDEVSTEGPPDVVTITARSADFQGAIKDQREASYKDTTLGDILTTVAKRNALTPAIHPDLAAVAIAHIDQTNESDANFLTRLGEDHDAIATIKAGHLLFVPAGTGMTAGGVMLPTQIIQRQRGDRHSFRVADRATSTTGVAAKWNDLTTGKTQTAIAGDGGGSLKTLKKIYPNQSEAQAAADAALKKRKRGAYEFSTTLAVGNPAICAGMPLTLSGWRDEICTVDWVTGNVTHTLDGGLTTDITAHERATGS